MEANLDTFQLGLEVVGALWPVFVGFILLVLALGKLFADIDTLKEKVKTLFELFNSRDK
mgnify:CR=1 FL=1|tara:strand:- start:259 stop:435 length:177 start_codon:yes stop_codon:yes gene_type:complete